MNIVFISDYLNHHQLALVQGFYKETNGNFTFIATEPVSESRLKLGYRDLDHSYPFVLCTYDTKENNKKAMEIVFNSDVVIIGSAPDKYIIKRLKYRKLTFRYSERFLKQGMPKSISLLKTHIGQWLHHGRFKNLPLYLLTASAYASYDYSLFKNYIGKSYKWGYFPAVQEYNIEELMNKKRNNNSVKILWCGRLIDWKHPEAAVILADSLKNSRYNFELNIIGTGNIENNIKDLIVEKGLTNCVHMLGSMHPEQVRQYMENSNIFIFTSDFNEGWGAVLNEAMNSGCAVVASHAIGSVPYLINDGENGIIYENGNQEQLYNKVRHLIDSSSEIERLGLNAYNTMCNSWNAKVATKRFMQLFKDLLKNKKSNLFSDGICSHANILKNDWYKN